LVIGVVLIPLGAEIHWRADAVPGAHAQPEVAVIERAGDRVAEDLNPYPAAPSTVGVSPSSDAHGTDSTCRQRSPTPASRSSRSPSSSPRSR
jgi:hypothetical protein